MEAGGCCGWGKKKIAEPVTGDAGRLEDMKESVRAVELRRNSDNLHCFHSAFIGGL